MMTLEPVYISLTVAVACLLITLFDKYSRREPKIEYSDLYQSGYLWAEFQYVNRSLTPDQIKVLLLKTDLGSEYIAGAMKYLSFLD